MFPQRQSEDYRQGINEPLLAAVPATARRILEVGCANGALGAALKSADRSRTVIGVEIDAESARAARDVLDEVLLGDCTEVLASLDDGSFDCVVFGDVLEHLVDPESVLRRAGALLAENGTVLVSVPNVQHHSVLRALVRGDLMYQPSGILDATHLRFFTYATFSKLMLDAGLLPQLVETIRSGGTEHLMPSLVPLCRYYGVDPDRALKYVDSYQYIFAGRPLPAAPEFSETPLTFVACVNDDAQLESNLLRSPCLAPGTPHQVVLRRGEPSAADGLAHGVDEAQHDIVILVQQDMYLPRGWDTWFTQQWQTAEASYGRIGIAGVFGGQWRDRDEITHVGRVVDRDAILDMPTPLPAQADSLDEIVLAVARDSELPLDPAFGFHLYGVDASLTAATRGEAVVVLDAPCLHNSLFSQLSPAFHEARRSLLDKWPGVRPMFSNMGQLDGMSESIAPPQFVAPGETELAETERELARLRADLETAQDRLAAIESTRMWRARRVVGRGRRRLSMVR